MHEGDQVKRGDELGWFAFGECAELSRPIIADPAVPSGGSTIVLLFERGALRWDEDLLQNGRASIETLVRMGSHVGMAQRKLSTASTPPQESATLPN